MVEKYFIVVGGGLVGLMLIIKVVEKGVYVDLFLVVLVKCLYFVCV